MQVTDRESSGSDKGINVEHIDNGALKVRIVVPNKRSSEYPSVELLKNAEVSSCTSLSARLMSTSRLKPISPIVGYPLMYFQVTLVVFILLTQHFSKASWGLLVVWSKAFWLLPLINADNNVCALDLPKAIIGTNRQIQAYSTLGRCNIFQRMSTWRVAHQEVLPWEWWLEWFACLGLLQCLLIPCCRGQKAGTMFVLFDSTVLHSSL